MKLFAALLIAFFAGLGSGGPVQKCNKHCTTNWVPVCAFHYCFLSSEECALSQLNCERKLRGKRPIHMVNKGMCDHELMQPRCEGAFTF